jgi:hypothetical protein
VAGSTAEYVRLAVQTATDSDRRHELADRIRAAAGQLFEDRRAVTEFQDFLLSALS